MASYTALHLCTPIVAFSRLIRIPILSQNWMSIFIQNKVVGGDADMWESCAAALDGFIYFMPWNARRIMKLDPNNNDAMSSIGDDLGYGEYKYSGTIVGMCMEYLGISNAS